MTTRDRNLIGIDLGGTKIEAILMAATGEIADRRRIPTPRHDYAATLDALRDMANALDPEGQAPVGIGMPGSISPATKRVQNANSTWLNGKPFAEDVRVHLARPVRLANDADCFALSEATDGAGSRARSVFGVILGTGCGGGIVIDGRLKSGPHAAAGEWGHTPLPWTDASEIPAPTCWCGRLSCMETWVSGPAIAADHKRATGEHHSAEQIARAAASGDEAASATLARHAQRLARGLALVTNILDPDVIVLGGGLSELPHLYEALPRLMAPHIFADAPRPTIRPPKWGATSGVRGAAWLWRE